MAEAAPQTVDELIKWFEGHFQCFVGPARSYFEIALGSDFTYCGLADARYRGIYQTYAVKTDDFRDAERRLVKVMHSDFLSLAGCEHSLFWRLPEKCLLKREKRQGYGVRIATREVVEDYITCAPLAGIVVDECGNWYENGGTLVQWELRTRLCIPSVPWDGGMITLKHEGVPVMQI